MPLEVQGPRELSPLEKDALYIVFGTPEQGIAPSELQLEVVESIGGPGGQGLRNIDQEMAAPSIQGGSLQEILFGRIKQVSVDSTYDSSGLITISRSAFPHTDDLHERSTFRNTKKLKPANIHYLSTFIYQCTRYWQWVYDRRRTPIRNSGSAYHFTTSQLIKDNFPELVAERHASAAQVYFVLAWQVRHAPWTRIEGHRKFADIDLTSGPPDNEQSVGPVDRYDEIVRIKRAIGRPIVTYEVATNLMNNFRDYILDLQDAGIRKRSVCAEAMQAAQIHPTSPFYDPL